MKLYKTIARYEASTVTNISWQGTQADANKARKTKKENGGKDIETEEVDVPTDKAGLLAWLNGNVTGE